MAAFESVSADTFTAAGASSLESAAWTIGGSDRCLFGFMGSSAGANVATHSAMRRNGSAGTLLTSITSLAIATGGRVSAWRLIAPAAANETIYGLLSDVDDEVVVGGTNYTGVDQTTPVGTTATNTGSISSVSSGTMSVTLATASGDTVLAVFYLTATSAANPAMTPSGTPTPTGRYEIEGAQLGFAAMQMQEVVATGTSTTVSCDFSSGGAFSGEWGAIAFVVNSTATSLVEDSAPSLDVLVPPPARVPPLVSLWG